jgi:hypothetical protein
MNDTRPAQVIRDALDVVASADFAQNGCACQSLELRPCYFHSKQLPAALAALDALEQQLAALDRYGRITTEDEYFAALRASEERAEQLAAALEQYADARNWGISRDDLNHRVCSWIGDGALEPIPDGPRVARKALAGRVTSAETSGT